MKRLLLMTVVLLLPAMSLAEPNFTGTWVRDGAKSDVVPNTMYWLTRGVEAGGGRGRNAQTVIDVQHSAGRMRVADPGRPVRTVVLDHPERHRDVVGVAGWQGPDCQDRACTSGITADVHRNF